MRAYLAILKDSFREALASRVLLIALIGIVVVLLLLSPFSLRYENATQLRRSEIVRPERLLTELKQGANEEATPQAHLWSLLSEEQRSSIDRLADPEVTQSNDRRRGHGGSPLERDLVKQVNQLIQHEDLYDADSWTAVKLPEEATALLSKPSLDEPERKRRNLLLLVAAFPRSIRVTDSQAISLTYANATVVDSIPLTPTQFEPIFERILVAVITVFLGFFGIFASLLVTAGLIPRTFEPGEIALLLSKPVNRAFLFVTKFLGGCTFTLLYATVLVTGIWLLLGIRMNFWRVELLWCIPVYVFLFMIYFSISAVAGAIWRNSIVALSLVVVFWLVITVIGATKEGIEDNIVRSRGIKEVTPTINHMLTVDGNQNTYVWDSTTDKWNEIFRVPPGQGLGGFARRFFASGVRFAPVFDPAGERILALQQSQSRFRGLGPPELIAGYADDDWERIPLGRLPDTATTILLTNDGRVILPTLTSICEYIEKTEAPGKGGDLLSSLTGGLFGGGSKEFRQLQSKDFPELSQDFACDLNPTDNSLLFYDGGILNLMTAGDDGKYSIAKTRNVQTDKSGVLAVAGTHAILGLGDGRILVLNSATLETVHETKLSDGILPRNCDAAADGSALAVLTHDETVLLFNGETGEPLAWRPPESGRCSAVAFSPDGRLLVSDGRLAVREYDIASEAAGDEWAETPSWVYQLYDLAIHPLWTVLPKPSELDQFVPYVMTGESTVLVNEANGPPGIINRNSLQQERTTFDAERVIRDNAIFVIVVLAFGCFIIARRDF